MTARLARLWPVWLAVAIRMVIWALLPEARFASDEGSYVGAARQLVEHCQQDVFWPPLTGWLIAAVRWLFGPSHAIARGVWVALDVGTLVVLRLLAARVGAVVWPSGPVQASRFTMLVSVGYALYLPAISHAQFTTSETPALLLLLLALLALTSRRSVALRHAGVGVLLGALVLARPNLAPLGVVLPLAARARWSHALLSIAISCLIVAPVMMNTWATSGVLEVANSASYNLWLGNRPMYAEDLDLFRPAATQEQIDIRRAGWSAQPPPSALEQRRQALEWISANPATFARRVTGRLARVFVPKTDVLELVGGERRAGIFAPGPLGLLLTANAEWSVMLFAGLAGLFVFRHRAPGVGLLFASTIVAATVLCLVAISKPRYSFVFEPLLLMGAALVLESPRAQLGVLNPRDRIALGATAAFLAWGWLAWLVFAFSSRLAAP